jgi:hypothetical protein
LHDQRGQVAADRFVGVGQLISRSKRSRIWRSGLAGLVATVGSDLLIGAELKW